MAEGGGTRGGKKNERGREGVKERGEKTRGGGGNERRGTGGNDRKKKTRGEKKREGKKREGKKTREKMFGVFLHCVLCCLITWATHSHPFRSPVYCGCQPGLTGVLIHPGRAVDQQCANPLAAALLLPCTELMHVCACDHIEHAATNTPLGRMHVS